MNLLLLSGPSGNRTALAYADPGAECREAGMVGAIQDATTLAAGVGHLVNGLSPDWGPFGAVGAKAQMVIQVLMAAVVLILFGTAVWGAWQIRVGNSQQNTMDVKQGKTMVLSSLAGLFLIASMSTIFGIVFDMGV
ncbi:hypothetical protein PUR49_11260 [Streptomyces sp. BE147]|uniref:hypothetical protein n=1 Tax=Streptomyces sp. BE147 TaxID=3002524 RepID=UPI002E761718|nr:hypothetical protein [Streptomyces sp. BE147]MEE1737074.1 hypothetical protein [Streptomyces sp. BE147]